MISVHPKAIAARDDCIYAGADSRTLLRRLPSESIDCVITSPPYGHLKDYGANGQIGYGQATDDEYLKDIAAVLHDLYRACRDGAALWAVLDTVKKRSGQSLLLPWEVITRAREAKWQFEDLVIWDKGRSLPWSHVGHFRGVFEYILLFSKGKMSRFALDRAREVDHLSSYWVKYPERFNPGGKAASDIWHFPIPVQGSWSRNGIRHFCPFPMPMVARMISLTTEPGEVVLDPFAGTGTVMAVAHHLGRRSVGIDVNDEFVRKFEEKGFKALALVATSEIGKRGQRTDGLREFIVRLRALKYPKTLFVQLSRPDRLGEVAVESIGGFIVNKRHSKGGNGRPKGVVGCVSILLLARKGAKLRALRNAVAEMVSVPPLSKFGLDVDVRVIKEDEWQSGAFRKHLPKGRWYLYTKGGFQRYDRTIDSKDLPSLLDSYTGKARWKVPPILSRLRAKTPAGADA